MDTETSTKGYAVDLGSVPVPAFAVDATGNILSWNCEMESLTGREPADVMGKKAWRGFFVKRQSLPVDEALETGESLEEELEFVNAATKETQRCTMKVVPADGRATVVLGRSGGEDEQLGAEVKRLLDAVVAGNLSAQADLSHVRGESRAVLENVNRVLATVVGLLDTIPSPLMAIDREFNITYMNHVGAAVGDRTPKDLIGTKCYDHFRTSDCRSDRCACQRTLTTGAKAHAETDAHPGKLHLQIAYDAVPLRNPSGQTIGAFEIVTDQTVVKAELARADKLTAFRMGEASKVRDRLAKCAVGDFDFETTVAEGDAHTAVSRSAYLEIASATAEVRDTLKSLVADVGLLSHAAVDGKLAIRADAAKHRGGFKEIVQGVNDTVDSLIEPVNDALGVLEQLAARDLRARVTSDFRGDHAKLKVAINSTGEALHDALLQVSEAVEQVVSASDQIASSSQSIAQGASEQASSLEETSSSLEEMSGMTRQNADNTQQARALATGTKETADKGSRAMEMMTRAMSEIRASAEGTAAIIRDINEIAFQTNLLALNAAVEAARAGDAGRGFAVVAEEVRNLAQRSKEAAKKTEELIHSSVKFAEQGQVLSKDVNGNLSEIVEQVAKVTNIVGEITVASQEQARGIEQVNKAVAEMDQVTQKNATASEESSAAAEELSSQARDLAAMVDNFKIAKREPTRAVGRSKVAAPATRASGVRQVVADKRHTNGKSRHARPEEAIPFEDDQDFKGF